MKYILLVLGIITLVSCGKTGTKKTYYDNGKLKSIEHFEAGELKDSCSYYFENGQLQLEVEFYKGDVRAFTIFEEDGKIDAELKKDNIYRSKIVYTDFDDDTINVKITSLESKNSYYSKYFKSGQLYITSENHLSFKSFQRLINDRMRYQLLLVGGNNNRNQLPWDLDDSDLYSHNVKFYFDKIPLTISTSYDYKGKFDNGYGYDGSEREFYESGKIKYVANHVKGELIDETYYHANGRIESSYITADGAYISYHENGRIKSEGYYVMGMDYRERDGEWKEYNSDGSLNKISYYVKGHLNNSENY
jgi:antitoxin component YwqK of YwqJK toxin-antitoxin module